MYRAVSLYNHLRQSANCKDPYGVFSFVLQRCWVSDSLSLNRLIKPLCVSALCLLASLPDVCIWC